MSRFISLKLFVLIVAFVSPAFIKAQKKVELNVATYNIRLNIASDGINAWPNRKEWVKELIQYHSFDIFGVQEALNDQMNDLASIPGFSYVGGGRDDGKTGGEYSAIFYKTEKYTVLQSGTFWLSQTPDTPSKGWDAAYPRICTWAHFKDKKTRKQFFMFNTHFDHMGEQARQQGAKLILKKINELNAKNIPVFITGDFNSSPQTVAYATIVEQFTDAKLISQAKSYGPEGTFNGFDYMSKLPDGRIDFVFVSKDIEVLKYGVLTDTKEQRFPSDHFPVACRLKF